MPSQWYDNRRAIRNRIDAADDTIERWIAEERDDTNSEAPPFEPTPEALDATYTAAVTVNTEWLAYMLEYARAAGYRAAVAQRRRQQAKRAEFRAALGLSEDEPAEDATLNPIPGVKLYRVVANGETLAGGMTWLAARVEREDRYRSDPGGHYTIVADASETDSHGRKTDQSTLGRAALARPVPGVHRYAIVRKSDWRPLERRLTWENADGQCKDWNHDDDDQNDYVIVADSSEF